MSKQIRKTIYIILSLSILLLNVFSSFADKINVDYSMAESDFDSNFSLLVGSSYDEFLANLKNKTNMGVKDVCWIQMNDKNDKLIIGASGVVWCGYTMTSELDTLGYDVIGFGGVTDHQIKEWIPYIDKKYDKVIIFAGVNTINLSIISGITELEASCAMKISETIESSIKNLLYADGTLQYVAIKEMIYPDDSTDQEFVFKFNKLAKRLNNCLSENNIDLYTLKYPTTKEFSNGYVHYNNRVVWVDMLR